MIDVQTEIYVDEIYWKTGIETVHHRVTHIHVYVGYNHIGQRQTIANKVACINFKRYPFTINNDTHSNQMFIKIINFLDYLHITPAKYER